MLPRAWHKPSEQRCTNHTALQLIHTDRYQTIRQRIALSVAAFEKVRPGRTAG